MKGNAYKKVGNSSWYTDDGTSRSEMNSYLDSVYSENPSTGKKRSKPRKKKKCDHKHEWSDVLLETSYRDPLTGKQKRTLHLGKKCSICDLIKETKWFITVKEGGIYRNMTYDEIKKQYSDLEIIDYLG